MIFSIESYMETTENKSHGVGIFVLKLDLRHGDADFRDKVKNAIMECFHQKPEISEKQSALGFHASSES